MKDIDFLPDWYIQRMARRSERRRHTLWIILLLGSMAMWTTWEQGQIERAQATLNETRIAQKLQEPLVVYSIGLSDELTELRDKRALCANLSGGADMHAVLADLSRHQPDGVLLSGFAMLQEDRLVEPPAPKPSHSGEAKGPPVPDLNVTLRGYAQTESDVGRYIYALADSAAFEAVQLTYSKPAYLFETPVREFEIRCRLPQFD